MVNLKTKQRNVLYIERMPDKNYAIKLPNVAEPIGVERTQREAIATARKLHPGFTLHVERVRHTKSGNRDKWRKL